MNEIEKLYENVGIEPDINYICDKEPCKQYSVDCQECSHLYDTRVDYPDFTAEKQIELIKWLESNDNYDFLEMFYKPILNIWTFRLYWLAEFANEDAYISIGVAKTFEDGLANLIINLWQSLTEEEKQQIREILE